MSILPQPKYSAKSSTHTLIPNSVKQKVNIAPTPKQDVKIALVPKTKNLTLEYSDDDSGDEGTDFFAINQKHDLPVVPLDIDEPCKPKVKLDTKNHDIQSYFKPMDTDDSHTEETASHYDSTNNVTAESSIELDDEAVSVILLLNLLFTTTSGVYCENSRTYKVESNTSSFPLFGF